MSGAAKHLDLFLPEFASLRLCLVLVALLLLPKAAWPPLAELLVGGPTQTQRANSYSYDPIDNRITANNRGLTQGPIVVSQQILTERAVEESAFRQTTASRVRIAERLHVKSAANVSQITRAASKGMTRLGFFGRLA